MGLEISSEGGALRLKSTVERSRQDAEIAGGVVCSEGRLRGNYSLVTWTGVCWGGTVGMCFSPSVVIKMCLTNAHSLRVT